MLNYPTVCAQGSLSRETRQQSRKQLASHVSRRRRGCRHKPSGLQEIAVHPRVELRVAGAVTDLVTAPFLSPTH